MQQACQTFAEWQRRFPQAGLDYITVNVSSRQLMQQNFVRVVQQAVAKAGLKPADLRVEITETALMDSPGEAAGVLRELRDFGAKVYLDDFGTGYSSLSHLHKLPVDALKIDRSFVKSLLLPDRPAIVESILALARTLNTSVVAEGIESEVQARELERLGCTHAQGFLFSRPLSTMAAEALVDGVSAARSEGHGRSRPAAAGGLTHSADRPARPSRRLAASTPPSPGHRAWRRAAVRPACAPAASATAVTAWVAWPRAPLPTSRAEQSLFATLPGAPTRRGTGPRSSRGRGTSSASRPKNSTSSNPIVPPMPQLQPRRSGGSSRPTRRRTAASPPPAIRAGVDTPR